MTATMKDAPRKTAKAALPVSLTKLMLFGRRAPLHTTPASVGLGYVDVAFHASDGVALRGWFIPGAIPGPAPAVAFVHGWLWNRLGNVEGHVPFADKSVDFLPATRALHDAGIGVLLFDLRNHGRSGRALPITYGVREGRDVQGAIAYLGTRPDVDSARIGALGCSMGANSVLYGAPYTPRLKAALAVQPARVKNFNRNFARQILGPAGPAMVKAADPMFLLLRAPMLKDQNPAAQAGRSGDTVVQYVQGTGDPWGELADVEEMVAATPNALPLIRFESSGRYEGYRYVNEAVDDVARFFTEHL